MISINKDNLDKLIEHIKKGNIRIYYCSPDEINKKSTAVFSLLVNGTAMAKSGHYNEGMSTVFCAAGSSNLLSTEVIAGLFFILVSDNEFYYAATLAELCRDYFAQNDFSDVPENDMEFVVAAGDIWFFRYELLMGAFKSALTDDFEALKEYVTAFGCNPECRKPITKKAVNIKRDIKRYYDWR